MFEFKGTLSDLKTYLDATFTKKTNKTLELNVDAMSKAVQLRGTYLQVRAMLHRTFTSAAMKTLQLNVCILQPANCNAQGIREITSHDIPADVTLNEVHYIARSGRKIVAIKAYRTLTGVDLVKAKDYIEKYLGES